MARRPPKKFTRSYPKPVYRRPVRLRSKVKSEMTRKTGSFIGWFVLLALVGAGAWWGYSKLHLFIYNSAWFNIASIEISGCKNTAQSEISTLLPFRTGDNLWGVRTREAEKNIQQCKPELENISIRRGWKKVKVAINERKPAGFVMVNGEKLGIDSANIPFPLRGAWIHATLPEIDAATEGDRREILCFMADFSPVDGRFFDGISRFALEPVNSIIFDIKGGPRIYWGRLETGKLKAKLNKLTQVLKDSATRYGNGLSYINLSYFDDGRVIVMPALQNKR